MIWLEFSGQVLRYPALGPVTMCLNKQHACNDDSIILELLTCHMALNYDEILSEIGRKIKLIRDSVSFHDKCYFP